MTKKLYYEDSHQDSCHATVLSCEWNEKKQCYEVVLNQTVFFPEGGGKPEMIQGTVTASEEMIRSYMESV